LYSVYLIQLFSFRSFITLFNFDRSWLVKLINQNLCSECCTINKIEFVSKLFERYIFKIIVPLETHYYLNVVRRRLSICAVLFYINSVQKYWWNNSNFINKLRNPNRSKFFCKITIKNFKTSLRYKYLKLLLFLNVNNTLI